MIQIFLAIDPSLGRLDYASLSDQALMEMLIDKMSEDVKSQFQDTSGNFDDVCDWSCVACAGDCVIGVSLPGSHLHGTLETSLLPLYLLRLDVSNNQLRGSLNFAAFSKFLQCIDIRKNLFDGICALSDLPDTIMWFQASENAFSGEISLNDLSVSMKVLELYDLNLSGSISITRLPLGMQILNLGKNSFSGDLNLKFLPPSIACISVMKNPKIEKAVFMRASGEMPFELHSDSITAVFDESGEKHPWEETILRFNGVIT